MNVAKGGGGSPPSNFFTKGPHPRKALIAKSLLTKSLVAISLIAIHLLTKRFVN